MKIAVLVKQVPGGDSQLRINDNQNWVNEENVTFITNESDNYAIEEALQIIEKLGYGEVVAVSLGPERVKRTIREALSKGVDRGIHIGESYPYSSDPLEIAKIITKVIKKEKFDLILSGLQSDDSGFGQVGVLIGEILGMTTATLVMETELTDENLRVKRELESGWFQWVTLTLPASITVQSGINNLRYPSLKGIMGAKKKEIKSIQIDKKQHPTQSILRISQLQKLKKTQMINGSVDQQVQHLVNLLKKELKLF